MDKIIVGIVVIWGVVWLLGIVLRVLSDLSSAVGQQWARTRSGRQRVGHAIGRPMGVLAGTIEDHRLMSKGLAITLIVAAILLVGADSASLVSSMDKLGGRNFPILAWVIFGGVAGIVMGVGSRAIEFGWFGASTVSRVPDIDHLHAGERAATRYFRIRVCAAVVGTVILLSVLALSYSRNSGYDPSATIDTKVAAIAAAGTNGKIAVLNAALEDSTSRLQSDPVTGLSILAALRGLDKERGRPEVEEVATIARKYLDNYRKETEKAVSDGKPEAMARSEAFSGVDRVASLKWLGRLHEGGKGVAKRDLSKALSYYGEAALAGDRAAAAMQDKVARVMVSSKEEGVRQEAYKHLESKAQTGGPSDHYWVGESYVSSSEPEDLKKAEKWLGKALSQDSDEKVRSMAFATLSGLKDVGKASILVLDKRAPVYAQGKDENTKKAAYAYLERRANAGDPGATLWMGFRYATGDGVPKDEERAREWFLKAALQSKNEEVRNRAYYALTERNHPPIERTAVTEGPDLGVNNSSPLTQPKPASVAPPISPAREVIVNPVAPPTSPAREVLVNPVAPPTSPARGAIVIPPNASMDYYGHSWSCNKGYVQSRNECVPLQIPPNASMDYYGHSWSCNKGYVQSRNECVPLQIPPNASMDYYGHSWSCNKGYVQSRNECVPLQIPPNASMDYYGHSWSCNKGFVQVRYECVPLANR